MDKEMYKQLTADYMRREAKLLITVSELKDKLNQQEQDFHFDMRNKQMEIVMLENRIKSLEKHRLELIMENGELKDMVLDNGGNYAETDGYEVGSPSDYEEDKQLNLFND
jgi:hypothetical protein